MLSHISYSSLSMALKCGEQLRRRYFLGQIIPPAVAMGMGRGIHKASEINLKQKVVTKKDIPKTDMIDAARDAFIDCFKNGVYLAPEEVGQKEALLNEAFNKTRLLTELYADTTAFMIEPLTVEDRFLIDIPGVDLPLMGFIDCVEHGALITDLKATSKSWPKNKIEVDMQPVFYTIAYKHLYSEQPSFRFMVHVALKRAPKLQQLTWQVTEPQEVALYARIRAVVDMLNKGVFLPANPADWWCSPKWCGYYQTCKFVGNGEEKAWV